MSLKFDGRLTRIKSITQSIRVFLRNIDLQSPKIWQWSQRFFCAKPLASQKITVAKKTRFQEFYGLIVHTSG